MIEFSDLCPSMETFFNPELKLPVDFVALIGRDMPVLGFFYFDTKCCVRPWN